MRRDNFVLLKMNIMKKIVITGAFFLLIGVVSELTNPVRANDFPGSGMRNILSTELPAVLRADIKKEYSGYWITALYEVGGIKKPSYFITVENADDVIKMSSDDSETWVITSTTAKDN
jgi:hypothetical protein